MISDPQRIFSRLNAARLAADAAGSAGILPDGCLKIPSPLGGGRFLSASHNRLDSLDRDCPVVSCNAFDFLAMRQAGREGDLEHYHQAVDRIIARFGGLMDADFGEARRAELVEKFYRQRRTFLEITQLARFLERKEPFCQDADAWFRDRRIAPERVSRMIHVCQGRHLHFLEGNDPAWDAIVFLVFPYFAQRNLHAHIVIQSADGKIKRSIPINPARHSFFGLHQPGAPVLYPNAESALAAQSSAELSGDFRTQCLHVHIDRKSPALDNALPSAALMFCAERNFRDTFEIRGAAASLEVIKQSARLPWRNHLVDVFSQRINDASALEEFFSLIRHDPELVGKLFGWMRARSIPVAARLEAMASPLGVVYTGPKFEIRETPLGWSGYRPASGETFPVTNFTVSTSGTVWFPKTGERFVDAHFRLGQAAGDLLFSSNETGAGLEKLACRALSKFLPGLVPSVFCRSSADMAVSGLLEASSKQPSRLGLDLPGWSDDRSELFAGGWTSAASGVTSGRTHHPDLPFLNLHYSCKSGRSGEEVPGPVEAALLCGVVGFLARSFARMYCPVLQVLDSDASQRTARAIFSAFGQRRPFNFSSSGSVQSLAGVTLPVLAAGPARYLPNRTECPVALLSDHGLDFGGQPGRDPSPFSARVLQQVSQALIVSPQLAEGLPSDTTAGRLMESGRGLILAALGLDLAIKIPAPRPAAAPRLTVLPDAGAGPAKLIG